MKELKKFNVLSVGKVFGLFGFVISIIQMIFFKLISMNSNLALQYGIGSIDFTFRVLALGVIGAAIIYFIAGLVVALIYNLIARYVGGIMFDSDDAKVSVKKIKKKARKK